MWSIWMFTIPSLRAKECMANEKDALNLLFVLVSVVVEGGGRGGACMVWCGVSRGGAGRGCCWRVYWGTWGNGLLGDEGTDSGWGAQLLRAARRRDRVARRRGAVGVGWCQLRCG